MTAWHIYCWYRANRFCGCCGEKTAHDPKERMMHCPACGATTIPDAHGCCEYCGSALK